VCIEGVGRKAHLTVVIMFHPSFSSTCQQRRLFLAPVSAKSNGPVDTPSSANNRARFLSWRRSDSSRKAPSSDSRFTTLALRLGFRRTNIPTTTTHLQTATPASPLAAPEADIQLEEESILSTSSSLYTTTSPADEDALAFGDGMGYNMPIQPQSSPPADSAPLGTPQVSGRRRLFRRGFKTDKEDKLRPVPVPTNHEALGLLKDRALSGSKPGARSDSFKLGLVVEGGGMRGCVSGGALQALADLGLRECFDSVYGASAGALNATYFLSGQRDGVDIYHDYIANEKFIDIKRLWKSGDDMTDPALNLNYLIDHVMEKEHPLDWDAVLNSPIPLKVVASSLDTLLPVLLENYQDKEDLATSLRASANVPEVAGRPIEHRGQLLVDAAVFEPVPFRSAIADGCTHVLVLCTRPLAQQSRLRSALKDAVHAAIKKAVLSPDYMLEAWKAEVEHLVKDGCSQDEMLAKALLDHENAPRLPWFAGAHVYPVYPRRAASSFSPLCTDVPTLKVGVAEGRRMVMEIAKAALGDAIIMDGEEDGELLMEMNMSTELNNNDKKKKKGRKNVAAGSNIMPLPRRERPRKVGEESSGIGEREEQASRAAPSSLAANP